MKKEEKCNQWLHFYINVAVYIRILLCFFFFLTLSSLEASLGQSEQRVCELSRALAQSEEQLSQLQSLSQSQSRQIQQLQDVCTQLSGVREMNEVSIREGICLI